MPYGRLNLDAKAVDDTIQTMRQSLGRCLGDSKMTDFLDGATKQGIRAAQLAVDQEVGEQSTGTPGETVRPSSNARRVFLVYDHVPTDDQPAPPLRV